MSTRNTQDREFDLHFHGAHATFPFHEMDDDAFDVHIGINKAVRVSKPKMRGNYIAGYILAQHRIQAKKYQPRWRNLEGIFTLPMELLIRIFETLHPIDLYHIILTTRGLRALLLSRSASAIWKSSFEAYPEIPFYSAGVSAPKWASLLFGPATCDECGRTNTLPDFIHYTRKCGQGCSDLTWQDDRWLSNLQFPVLQKYYSAISGHIWKLARKTFIIDIENLKFLRRYSKKDVTELASKMERYMEDISAGIPGAQTAYNSFIQETRNAERKTLSDMMFYLDWADLIMNKCLAPFNASIKKYSHIIEKILAKRGHDPRDIASSRIVDRGHYGRGIKVRWDICSEPVLTKRFAWRSIAIFDQMVADLRKSRLAREHKEQVDKRRDRLNRFYTLTAKAHIDPKIAPFLHSLNILENHPIFHDYLHDGAETVVDVTVVPDAEGIIQRFIASVIRKKKQHLVTIMVNAGVVAVSDGQECADRTLELATALFERVAHDHVFIGWDEAGVYTDVPSRKRDSLGRFNLHFTCKTGGDPGNKVVATEYDVDLNCTFKFSIAAMNTLKEITELIAVDWRTVPAKVLDALGKRFVCKICPCNGHDGRILALDWRECVNHWHRCHIAKDRQKCGSTTGFALLSDEMTRVVRHFEVMYPEPTDLAWACCHCTEFLANRVTRTAAIAHTRIAHGISKPVVDRDFFYHKTESSLSQVRAKTIFRLEANAGHCCLKCRVPHSLRLRFKKDLMKHLVYGHKIGPHEIIEGEHWAKVKPFEDEACLGEILRRKT